MKIKSKALEVNIADYHIDVTIDAKYSVLQEVMSRYYGLMDGLNTFLKELSHPYRNWKFIIQEARSYSLDYFYLLKNHPKGHEAAALFVNIFTTAIKSSDEKDTKADGADNLLLFLQKIIKDSGPDMFGLKMLARNNGEVKYYFDGVKLNIWLLGPLMTKIKLARFANYFAMMYSSGITVLDALKISEDMVDNLVLEDSIKKARASISEGVIISKSFEAVGVFPSMIVRMLKVGEDTGAMDDALLNVSYFYNREVKESIEKIEPAILPVLTVLLGGIMMWIMMAVLGPVYDAVAGVKI